MSLLKHPLDLWIESQEFDCRLHPQIGSPGDKLVASYYPNSQKHVVIELVEVLALGNVRVEEFIAFVLFKVVVEKHRLGPESKNRLIISHGTIHILSLAEIGELRNCFVGRSDHKGSFVSCDSSCPLHQQIHPRLVMSPLEQIAETRGIFAENKHNGNKVAVNHSHPFRQLFSYSF